MAPENKQKGRERKIVMLQETGSINSLIKHLILFSLSCLPPQFKVSLGNQPILGFTAVMQIMVVL